MVETINKMVRTQRMLQQLSRGKLEIAARWRFLSGS